MTWQIFWSNQALDHPKQSSIEWVTIKTIKLIITHSILNCFWWSRACLKVHRYKNPYLYLYPCVSLPVTCTGFKTHAVHYNPRFLLLKFPVVLPHCLFHYIDCLIHIYTSTVPSTILFCTFTRDFFRCTTLCSKSSTFFCILSAVESDGP